MSKPKFERRLKDNEAQAIARSLRVSPQKLNLVAQLIRGKKVEKALADLTFSRKRIAQDVKKTLQSAIANAENNHSLDVDQLIVAEAFVGKSRTVPTATFCSTRLPSDSRVVRKNSIQVSPSLRRSFFNQPR